MAGQKLMMIVPAFVFGINGKVDIEFDDFEEISEHPMAAPAMATFSEFFQNLTSNTPDSWINKKIDREQFSEETEQA